MVVRRAPEQGMTLVELMVTMVIASIVAASTFMFFAGQQRVYETQTKMLNVQQNAWAAMEVLTRFVRASGSGMYGCVRPVGGIVPAPPLQRTPDATSDDSDDPPALPNAHGLSQVPNAGLRASLLGGTMQRIPPLWIVDQADPTQTNTAGIKAQTDVITVAFGNRASGTTCDASLAADVNNVTDLIKAPTNFGAMFQANEFILLVNDPPSTASGYLSDIGCTLFQISSVSTDTLLHASTLQWNPGSIVPNMIPFTYRANKCDPGGASGPVSNAGIRNLGEFWWVQFAVRTPDASGNYVSGGGGIPVLTMQRLDGSDPNSPQVLAQGIEDLQVAFACDLNADGLLNEGQGAGKVGDEWTLNSPSDVIALNRAAKCNQPSAIRLTLVARSLTEDNGIAANASFNGPPTVENHLRATCCGDPSDPNTPKPATCCDQYRRRVLSTTVYPRNN